LPQPGGSDILPALNSSTVKRFGWLQYAWGSGVWLAALLVLTAAAENSKISYPPVPDWVREAQWTDATNSRSLPKSAGTRLLLYEAQDRPKQAAQFARIVELMVNDAGVQDSGSLRFSFNAEFQDLCLHRVVIHRGSNTIDRLNPAQVRIIQPEPELGGHVLTGEQTAVLFVEDLRVGDVLEYAYTLHGANPVFKGHYATQFTVQSGSPVDREVFRVVWDDSTPLFQRAHLTAIPPAVQTGAAGWDYTWSYTNLAAIPFEDYQPASFEPYPYVEVSDFADWRSVVDWALPLYGVSPTNVPPEVRQLVRGWESAASSAEEKVRCALQFVQDDLRYTALELGPDSYRPADPLETFQKRFGDCKGKAVLLRFLLKQMDIESYPALVSSSDHEAIADRLPSPFVFNHVILQVLLNGSPIWLDPTESHQGGSLWTRAHRPFGKALVIRPENAALEDVPRNAPGNAWNQIVTSTFDIKGYNLPVGLTVKTEYRGSSADDLREQIASTDPNDLAKDYLNYYNRLYPGVGGGPPLKIKDQRLSNIVTIEEAYSISNLWTRDEPAGLWKATFYADNLYHLLTDPNTRIRKTPLALSYPSFRQQQIIVHLPDNDWQIPDVATNIGSEAFSFRYHRHLAGSTVTFYYECSNAVPSLPADRIPDYLAKRDHMEDLLSDTLQRPDHSTAWKLNWLMAVIALFGAAGTAAGCIWYWRHAQAASRTIPPPLPASGDPLCGLRGWLILVGFGLCLAPVLRLNTFGHNFESYFSNDVWQSVAMPQGGAYHPLYAPLLIFELLVNELCLGLNATLLVLFFTKRKAFPALYVFFLVGNAGFMIIDDVGSSVISAAKATGDSHVEVIRAVPSAIIWTLYALKSRRVKATFVR
jgi:transglutaminase-like putative cysteine protease